MRPELQREMHERAVRLAFPDWDLRDDDEITLNSSWDDSGGYCETCYTSSTFSGLVAVRRTNYDESNWETLYREDAAAFLNKLFTEDYDVA